MYRNQHENEMPGRNGASHDASLIPLFDTTDAVQVDVSQLRVGDLVQIRSEVEIVASLGKDGTRDRLPFMPEMLRFCGKTVRVSFLAHKTCDTVNRTGGRRMNDAVHLGDLRCDGSAHGGCQAECLLFWKTDWLKPVDESGTADVSAPKADTEVLYAATRRSSDGTVSYRCQATELFTASEPLAWWDVRQYWADVRSGNVTAKHALVTLLLSMVFHLRRLPFGYRINSRLYAVMHRLLKGEPDPHLVGAVPDGVRTPTEQTNLQVGELVEVRSKEEIERTIDVDNKNRGMAIDEEMTVYCGGRYRVSNRVSKIINESTGEMMHFKNPCIVLEGVQCRGDYSEGRLLCPRRITAYWREIWLKRIDETPTVG